MEDEPLLDFDALSWSNVSLHEVDEPDDNVLGMAFHSKGISGIHRSGEPVKSMALSNVLARLAFPISRTELLLFHISGIYKASIETRTSSKLSGVKWGRLAAAVRNPRNFDQLMVFHEDGVYTVDVNSGSHITLKEGFTVGWAATRAVVHDPSNPEVLYIFHDLALYRVNLMNLKYERVGRDTWCGARAAIYHPTGTIVFHTDGTFRVQLGDGACERIAGGWPGARGVLSSGPETALLLHTHGAHEVNLVTGEFIQVFEGAHWADVVCTTPLASDVMALSAVCRYW